MDKKGWDSIANANSDSNKNANAIVFAAYLNGHGILRSHTEAQLNPSDLAEPMISPHAIKATSSDRAMRSARILDSGDPRFGMYCLYLQWQKAGS